METIDKMEAVPTDPKGDRPSVSLNPSTSIFYSLLDWVKHLDVHQNTSM